MTLRRTNYLGSALLAATTLVVAACSSGGGGYGDDDDIPVPAANTAPVISAITDRSADQDMALGIEFGITDSESGLDALTLTAVADGADLFPADGVVLSGSGATRKLTLTPLEAATGAANVTVTLKDPQGLTATRTFKVAVNARAASIRDWTLTTFAKAEDAEVTVMNGYTFTQDADDPAIFEPLIGTGEE